MNKVLEYVLKVRNGHYCHAFEVESCWDLSSTLDGIHNEFIDSFTIEDIIEFCVSAELYYLDEDNEDVVFNFDIKNYLLSI